MTNTNLIQRVKALEDELGQLSQHAQQRDASKDELIKSLQGERTATMG
jgi:hypothetical protein